MKVLLGHNRYQWLGGEDAVVKTECQLLKEAGHDVYVLEADNKELLSAKGVQALGQVPALFWSTKSYQRLLNVLKEFQPDIAHFHNIYFTLTPSVYDACHQMRVPVVQSLHNFRMLCANGLFFRDGQVCEDCVNKSSFEAIRHACFRQSSVATAAVVATSIFHHWRGTWTNKVDCYITAAESSRQKYIKAGVAESKIIVKPNAFYPDVPYVKPEGRYVLYVGRLSEEKGARRLLEAWKQLPQIPLKLVGEGPLAETFKKFAKENHLNNVEFLGHVDAKQYDLCMRGAKLIVIPSQCYESFPRIAVEAFAYGLPILASRLGSLQEITLHGETGFCFDHLNADDLALQVKKLWSMDIETMSQKVRQIYDQKYSPLVNVQQLVNIYQTVIKEHLL